MRLRTAQGGQSARHFAGDERFEPGTDQSGLLLDAGQALGFFHQLIVQVQCTPHMHQYARFVQQDQRMASVTPGWLCASPMDSTTG